MTNNPDVEAQRRERNAAYALHCESRQVDMELCAIDVAVQALSAYGLSNAQRWRILAYLQDRFGGAPTFHGREGASQ